MKNRFFFFTLILTTLFALSTHAAKRQKYNFNSEWRLQVGDFPQAKTADFNDNDW